MIQFLSFELTIKLTSFDSNGFTVESSSGAYNASGEPFVAWQWKMNGGTTTTNNDGNRTVTLQANATAGQSIMLYEGSGADGATFGHGLGAKPHMVVFKNRNDFEKASAWHDHGHENNPNVPRWEDTRKSSGFNYRMNEMQGAVGIAQLKKLKFIIRKQNENHDLIWDAIKTIPGITRRIYPKGSSISADALIIFVKNKNKALACRNQLLKYKNRYKKRRKYVNN